MIQDRKQAKDEAMRAAAAYIQAAPPQGPNSYSLQKKLRNTKDYLVGLAVGLLVAVAAVFFIKQFLPDSFYTHLTPLYNILPRADTAAPQAKSAPENVVPTPRQSAPTGAIANSKQTITPVPAQEVVPAPQEMSLASAPVSMKNIPGSFPEASARPLVEADLANKTGEQLLMMANEIFARHGYIFTSSKQTKLFKTFPWYEELHENVDDKLSGIEKQNIALILAAIAAPLAGNQNTASQTAATLTPTPAISTAVKEQPAESIPVAIAKPEPLPEKPAAEQVTAMAKETPAPVNPAAIIHEPSTQLATPVQPPTGLPGKYPETSLTILSPNDLAGRDVEELKLMRNEIFARHGYIFQSPQQQKYFSAQPWYRGERKNVTDMLTETENSNIALIKKME